MLLVWTFYFVDRRSFEEMRRLFERTLGCPLTVRETDDRRDAACYDGRVLGFDVTLRHCETWGDQHVYRTSGSPLGGLWTDCSTQIAMDEHVSRLLARAGVDRVLTPSEYGSEARRHRVQGSSG
jgi:hypothetical protein